MRSRLVDIMTPLYSDVVPPVVSEIAILPKLTATEQVHISYRTTVLTWYADFL